MKTLLKKLGIVAAATTAGLLAISPLAFAGDDDHHKKSHDDGSSSETCSADQTYNNGLVTVPIVSQLLNGNILSCDDVNVQVAVIGDNSVDQ